ncbi:MAG: hypothetical protein H0T84_12110 [Tatlockia sp.]|nr:hypothetical protein [Tatlockia sp.]
MAINESLRTLLDSNSLDNHPNRDEVIAALNAILAAGYDTPEAKIKFRQAIKEKHTFWSPLLEGIGGNAVNAHVDVNENVNFLVAEGEGDDDAKLFNNFEALTNIVAYKSAQLSLKKANDNQLTEIIIQSIAGPDGQKSFREKFFQGNGASVLEGENLKVKNWNPEQDNILSVENLEDLQYGAEQELLIRKINNCTDLKKINALLKTASQPDFTAAIKDIFNIPVATANTITDGMLRDQVYSQNVRHTAAKKGLSLLVENPQSLTDEYVLAASPGLLNALDPDIFRNNLEWLGDIATPSADALYDAPPADYMNIVKSTLGARFIALKATELGIADIEFIENIARSSDLSNTKNLLNSKPDLRGFGPDPYTNYAVTGNSLPNIRQAYATQALNLQIAQCDDVATLDALMQVSNVGDLKRVLSEKDTLKYKDKTNFHDAFTATADLNLIIANAHIRKNLSTGNPQHLKALIAAGTPINFKAAYHANLPAGTPALQAAINTHFSDNNNVQKARELALITFAKSELQKQNDYTILMGLVNAAAPQAVINNTQALLGSNSAADIVAGDPNTGVSKELRTFAAVEAVIKNAKEPQDLSKANGANAHDDLINNINTFTFAQPTPNGIWRLIASNSPESVLPTNEKQRIVAHLVESLIRNFPLDRIIPVPQPPARDKLTELAKAPDLERFKKQLNEKFNVSNTGWVNEKTMEQVQKSACIRLIELNQSNALKYTSRAHSKLMELISNLPLAKQQALLDNPLALSALAAVENKFVKDSAEYDQKFAENKNEIERILGGTNLVSDALIKAAVEESENLNPLSGIENYAIASTLAQIDPQVTVKVANVEAINRMLRANPFRALEANNTRNYQDLIQEIARGQKSAIRPSIYQAFGLHYDGTVVEQTKINPIINQHNGNQDLITFYNRASTSAADKVIISKLLTLNKITPVTQNQITNLITDVKEYKTLAEFTKVMKGPPGRNYYTDARPPFEPPLDEQLTPKMYEQLKTEIRRKILLDKNTYLEELDKQQEEIDAMKEKFSETQLGLFDFLDSRRLDRLTKITPYYWFNSAFQASAKKHALQLGEKLKELSKLCDDHITHFNNQIHAIEVQLESLPSQTSGIDPDIIDEISDRKGELNSLKIQVIEELGRYKAMQMIFKGKPGAGLHEDPILQEGLLKLIDEAKAGKKDLHLTSFNSSYEDYPISEREKHFKSEWTGDFKPVTKNSDMGLAADIAIPEPCFEVVDAVPKDHFREHTISYMVNPRQEDLGSYIEEHSSTSLEPVVQLDGTVDYPPSVKIIANKVMRTPEGRVNQAMEMACALVKSLTCPPTAEKPLLIIGSSDPEFAKDLWTALMLIGMDKNMKFGKEALKVVSAHFDPKTQLNFFGQFKDDSAHETRFKNNDRVVTMLEGIKDVNQKKFGDAKAMEEASEDIKSLTSSSSMRDRLFKIKEDNLEQEESTRPTLGSGGPKN